MYPNQPLEPPATNPASESANHPLLTNPTMSASHNQPIAISRKRLVSIICVVVSALIIVGATLLISALMSEAKEKARLRDVQRKEDMSRLATAVFHYEAKHRGALPDFSDANLNPDGACLTDDSGEPVYAKSFCGSYLIVNDTFADPSGVAYNIVAVNNYNGAGGSVFPAVVDYPLKIENDEILMVDVSDYKDYGYRFYVIYGATCNKEVAVATDKERKFAALYKLEQGGAICQSN